MADRRSLLQLDTSIAEAEIIVRAVGVLDISTVDSLVGVVQAQFGDGRPVTVDLSGVSVCDSTGLGGIVALEREARARPVVFALRDPGLNVSRIFAMTGLDRVIRIVRTRDGTVAHR